MRREIKLIILVFILVVGPAVAVSFLAARVLGNWQIVLQKRMETDAIRLLDQAMALWGREKVEIKSALTERGEPLPAPRSMAAVRRSHPWVEGIVVYEPGWGIRYPPPENPGSAPGPSWSAAAMPQAPATGIADVKRLLDQPGLEPYERDAVRLRAADLCWQAGATNQALDWLKEVADLGVPSRATPAAHTPSRDPDEGFFFDLIALKDLVEKTPGSAESDALVEELRLRVLARYEVLAPAQRRLLVQWFVARDAAGTVSRRFDMLHLEWQERLRGEAWGVDQRLAWSRAMENSLPSFRDEEWSRLRLDGRDHMVCKTRVAGGRYGGSPGRDDASSVVIAVQFSDRVVAEYLNERFPAMTTNAGIRIECVPAQGKESSRGETTSPVLATLRCPQPLETLVLVAYPSDPRAFLANARLQSRLYRWGGMLLMVSAIAGAWLIWRQASSEIRQARERSDFAAAVSHDLRTPLASMRMLAESLYMGNIGDEAKKKKFLGAIIRESDRLSRLTDRALYFIRYGQGALRYRFTEGDLGVLVRNAVEVFSVSSGGEFRLKGDHEGHLAEGDVPRVLTVLDIATALPPVRFDGGAMEQVVFNLLDNALKYSGKDTQAVIEVTLERRHGPGTPGGAAGWPDVWRGTLTGPVVVLSVRDHGVGMPPDDVKRILKPYARGKGAAKHNARGVGLGLALCHHVVKAHGGRIEIESAVGAGTTFRVMLPAG